MPNSPGSVVINGQCQGFCFMSSVTILLSRQLAKQPRCYRPLTVSLCQPFSSTSRSCAEDVFQTLLPTSFSGVAASDNPIIPTHLCWLWDCLYSACSVSVCFSREFQDTQWHLLHCLSHPSATTHLQRHASGFADGACARHQQALAQCAKSSVSVLTAKSLLFDPGAISSPL